jgi:hypothetical protein
MLKDRVKNNQKNNQKNKQKNNSKPHPLKSNHQQHRTPPKHKNNLILMSNKPYAQDSNTTNCNSS